MEMRKPGWLPALVPARDGVLAARDEERGFWRLWRYVESAGRSPEKVDAELAFKAAAAFGTFQRLLNDLPGETLVPTIEGFLELGGYLDGFDRALGSGTDTVNGLDELVGFVAAHRDLAARFPRGREYVHGDCKLDNLLFSGEGQEVVAVLDLDTVMPGHWAWDFGDLTRSLLAAGGRSPVEGDTVDLFRAVVHGFLDARDIRPPPEDLLDAPVYVAFMLGVRFLTDHLEGDHYFKVAARGDNLTRANRQFELVKSMEQHRPALERSVSAVLETLDAAG
jgi:Ser/Thr protein kinase RdoA (MazF antagonist)